MRYLEVRRHTMRYKPGEHLNQAGVSRARRVGEEMGPFARVITSPSPRAFETAIAMGFAVHETWREFFMMGEGVEAEVAWDAGFAAFAEAVRRGGAAARFAGEQLAAWRRIAEELPDGAAALVITHGGMIEAPAVAALLAGDHAAWGPFCDYCEGVRVGFDGEWRDIEILRVGPFFTSS